ncbi:MAG: peptidylprolyl isomerase [Saprospiraceae bacterium]
MRTLLYTVLLAGLAVMLLASCDTDGHTYAIIETDYGDVKVMLYDETPLHRDNFVKLADEGFFDSLLFHRVIPGFMIQGGDPVSKDAPDGAMLGNGGPGYELDPEIGAPHLRGALAAARTNNPQKKSSGSQFYIVQGTQVDTAALDRIAQMKGLNYNPTQRQLYAEKGGTPNLDGEYTVFGEVVEGMDVIDQIAKLPTDGNNRPTQNIRMKVRIL